MEDKTVLIKDQAGKLAAELSVGILFIATEICVPKLEARMGELPETVKANLLLEPLYFGVSYLSARAQGQYRGDDLQLFLCELKRVLLFHVIRFWTEPKTIGFAPPTPLFKLNENEGHIRIEQTPLTQDQEKLKAAYLHWQTIRELQYHKFRNSSARFVVWAMTTLGNLLQMNWKAVLQAPSDRLDKMWLVQALTNDFRDDNFHLPEAVLDRIVVTFLKEIYRIGRELKTAEYRPRAAA